MKSDQHVTIIACSHCGRRNRFPIEKLDRHPTCAACKAPLTKGNPIELTDDTFEDFVKHSPLPVLVDFWAPWCGPCKMQAPLLDRLAQKYAGKLVVGKLNTDQYPRASSRLGIQGIPTLIVFNGGREYTRHVGVAQLNQLEQMVPAA